MNHYREIKKLIKKLQAGVLDPAGREQLNRYLEQHPDYKDLFQTHELLIKSSGPFPDADTEQLSRMRAEVLRIIRQKEEKVPGRWQLFIEKIRDYGTRPEMAIAALTLIIGFFLGRALPPDTNTSDIMKKITVLAKENKKLEDIKKSPYLFSNVSMKEVGIDHISLSFDVTTHLDMVGKKDDPLVRDVLAQYLLNPTNVGSELKTIAYTEGIVDRKIKEALIFSMNHAPVLAVRLKAMQRLDEYKNDPQIQEAFLKVLGEEESVKMRLLAIDYLTTSQFPAEAVQKALSESEIAKSPAVLIKAKKYTENQ